MIHGFRAGPVRPLRVVAVALTAGVVTLLALASPATAALAAPQGRAGQAATRGAAPTPTTPMRSAVQGPTTRPAGEDTVASPALIAPFDAGRLGTSWLVAGGCVAVCVLLGVLRAAVVARRRSAASLALAVRPPPEELFASDLG